MPNHFHLLIKQGSKNGISKFLKQITNAYTEYFNKKYKRTGSLMQGPFKAVKINTEEQLVHLSRYIHLNPIVANLVKNLEDYQWSSRREFLDSRKSLCQKSLILDILGSQSKYKDFIDSQVDYAKHLKSLQDLTMDD